MQYGRDVVKNAPIINFMGTVNKFSKRPNRKSVFPHGHDNSEVGVFGSPIRAFSESEIESAGYLRKRNFF